MVRCQSVLDGPAYDYRRGLFVFSGIPLFVRGDGCDQIKSTILSWMAKSNLMDFESRRLLGHHLGQGAISTLTYSRDEMSRLQQTVFRVLRLIKNGEFDPDMSCVERLRAMVGIPNYPQEEMPEGRGRMKSSTSRTLQIGTWTRMI